MPHDSGLERFLSWKQVRELTGLGRTTAWRQRRAGDFPQPVPISPGRKAWREGDIVAWNATRGGGLFSSEAQNPAPKRPPSAPRPPEDRVLPLSEPAVAETPKVEMQSPPQALRAPDPPSAPSERGRRRSRPTVADGQLGFDF